MAVVEKPAIPENCFSFKLFKCRPYRYTDIAGSLVGATVIWKSALTVYRYLTRHISKRRHYHSNFKFLLNIRGHSAFIAHLFISYFYRNTIHPYTSIHTAITMHQGPYCFNELPKDMRSQESIVIFKSKLREHFYRKRTCRVENNLKALFSRFGL